MFDVKRVSRDEPAILYLCLKELSLCLQFKRMLNRELSHFAESSKSGNQIAEYICSTYLGEYFFILSSFVFIALVIAVVIAIIFFPTSVFT